MNSAKPPHEPARTPAKRIKFLFLVGVEGTGHQMIRAVMADCIERDGFIDERLWHKLMVDRWDTAGRFTHERDNPASCPTDRIPGDLDRMLDSYDQQGVTHLFESASFPFGQPRDALRRPDLIEFADLTNGLADLKCLVMYRNPVSTAYSAIRRGFTANIHLQAKIVESNYLCIAAQISQMPKESYRVLHFEDFLNNPAHYTGKLADWWELDPESLMTGLKNLRQPFPASQIPAEQRAVLDGFFTEKRIAQWKHFYERNRI